METPFSVSMFETLGQKIGPTPEELSKQAEAATRISKVNFVGYFSKILDLQDKADSETYTKLMQTLINGIANKTHILFGNDKQFLADKGTWLVHIEWGEFELSETLVKTVAPADTQTIKSAKDLTIHQIEKMGLETYGKD